VPHRSMRRIMILLGGGWPENRPPPLSGRRLRET
jgi:hypothetical protein